MEKRLSLETLNNVAEIEIVYRKKVNCKVSERPQVTSSADTYEILMHYWNQDKIELLEEFKVLFLSRSNRVLQIIPLSQGGVTGTVADPRLILATALKVNACQLILTHNHPSGSLKPSRADEELTQRIKSAAAYHDIRLLDHLIVSSEGYYSFADEGNL
ncbi:MAG: JAB domain-containing protein [Sphingobacteriales bacterium]|nr:JAB domain-containing protein [Sphingobacteriales bacterium]OJV98417.1 MAG: DNA repair protein [Sphingobacteriales bacterium 44-61]